MSVGVEIGGSVAAGFELVLEEFERNFIERGELGAAFAAEWNGEPVVDVWGGTADRATGKRWTADTMPIIFSGTKGLVACCLLLLLERGLLDLDAPVWRYWPEFAAAGKTGVLVRDVVAHTARLPGLETPVTWHEATDAERMAALLTAQAQSDDPRAAATYHALTYGWLCGEVVRRIDGRSIGRFFADEIAAPLELELWIGLPEELEPRVATVELADTWGSSSQVTPDQLAADPLLRSIANPLRYQPESFPWNERAWHAAEVPGANAIGTARSIAHLYGNLHRLVSAETLEKARHPLSSTQDTLLGRQTAFGIGFQLQTSEHPLGPPAVAFGHGGSGGSMHGCWPSEGIAFSYAMNLMRDDEDDMRARALLDALYAAVKKRDEPEMKNLALSDDAREYLELRLQRPPFWERDIADVRREMREESLALSGKPEPVTSVEELDADGVPSRLYRPVGEERDVVVWIHGGAWMLGDLDCYDSLARALANRARCAVLSIDYRLAPEHPFPAAIEDAWTATSWASHRFDGVAVGGDSAGGNLAAAVALRCRDRGIPLAHQLLVYPVLDYAVDSAVYREFMKKYRHFGPGDFGAESQEGIRRVWEVYIADEAQRCHPEAAPMRAASLEGLAPATIITAEHDILRGEAEAYTRRLRGEGIDVELINYEDQLHGFFHLLGATADARDAVDRAAAAFRRSFSTTARARDRPLH